MQNKSISGCPNHVGIIMDGNGRWAKSRNLQRTEGHRKGIEIAKQIVLTAKQTGIRFLTLFIFSTENWKRSKFEIDFLMKLLVKHLSSEFDFYRENNIHIVHTGDRLNLPKDVISELDSIVKSTNQFDGMTLNLAINHGGKDEIVRAVKSLALAGMPISESAIANAIDSPEVPDIDLIIRTGGERRLSNFMIWRSAYAEIIFSDIFWPDYTPDEFLKNIDDFAQRDRRYGGVK